MNFLRNHPFYSILILLVIILAASAYHGSKRIDRAPETIKIEGAYERPLLQD